MKRPPVLTDVDKLPLLRQATLFAEVSDADVLRLAPDFRRREFAKNALLFEQGDDSRSVYVVVSGKVRIYKISITGNETSINISSHGAVIGEFAPLDHGPRSASAKALDKCVTLEMAGDQFEYHLHHCPGLALGLARLLTTKIRLTATYAETFAQSDAAGRLLHVLLLYNEEFGKELIAGKRYTLDLALNQTDLASLVGARREHINRILRDWYKRGLIEYNGKEIIFLDMPRVRLEREQKNTDAAP